MKSIYKDLVFRMVIGSSLILTIGCLLIGYMIRQRLLEDFDLTLEEKLRSVKSLVMQEGNWVEFEYQPGGIVQEVYEDIEEPERLNPSKDIHLIQLQFENGDFIYISEGLVETPINLSKATDASRFKNIELEGEKKRMLYCWFNPIVEDEVPRPDEYEDFSEVPTSLANSRLKIQVAIIRDRAAMDQFLWFFYGLLGLFAALSAIGVVMLTRASVHRGLSPLEEFNKQVKRIDPDTLKERLILKNAPQELLPILNASNAMLERLDEAFARERRFNSAVAHELRTPVAELRMACEAGQMDPDNPEVVKRLFKDNHDVAIQMERIVANLLELTRCDSKNAEVLLEEIDLKKLADSCWGRLVSVSERRSLLLEDRITKGELIVSDRSKLEMILGNLIDNAISYSVSGSVIVFSSNNSDGSLSLIIENETNELTEEDLPLVFDRFWRKDAARSHKHHTGLGLSLVKALSELLEIKISVELKKDKRFQIQLKFPNHK